MNPSKSKKKRRQLIRNAMNPTPMNQDILLKAVADKICKEETK